MQLKDIVVVVVCQASDGRQVPIQLAGMDAAAFLGDRYKQLKAEVLAMADPPVPAPAEPAPAQAPPAS